MRSFIDSAEEMRVMAEDLLDRWRGCRIEAQRDGIICYKQMMDYAARLDGLLQASRAATARLQATPLDSGAADRHHGRDDGK